MQAFVVIDPVRGPETTLKRIIIIITTHEKEEEDSRKI